MNHTKDLDSGDIGYAYEKQRGDDMDVQTIENEALRLPPEDRAKLAQKLLLSLDTLSEAELEPHVRGLRERIAELEAEVQTLQLERDESHEPRPE